MIVFMIMVVLIAVGLSAKSSDNMFEAIGRMRFVVVSILMLLLLVTADNVVATALSVRWESRVKVLTDQGEALSGMRSANLIGRKVDPLAVVSMENNQQAPAYIRARSAWLLDVKTHNLSVLQHISWMEKVGQPWYYIAFGASPGSVEELQKFIVESK